MKINDDHLYHGAALTQIAEHSQFTAINAFLDSGKISRSSFLVNQDISIYLKYAGSPRAPFGEYVFSFNRQHLTEIDKIQKKAHRTFVVLICVKDRQVCCITHEELQGMIAERRRIRKAAEDQYTVLVTVPKNKSLRVYMNAPGQRKVMLNEQIVARNRFPNAIFEASQTT